MLKILFLISALIVTIDSVTFPYDKDFNWFEDAKKQVDKLAKVKNVQKKAKNLIMFLGDGMGMSTLTASRIYKGQIQGKSGEEGHLSFEQFPNVALTKTFTMNDQIPDSGATATAFLCGAKGNTFTLGVNHWVKLDDCSNMTDANKVKSFIRLAQLAGKGSGLVTNTRVTHATPAAVYSHVANRLWESYIPDGVVMKQLCTDIGAQLMDGETGKDLNVILGGGRTQFIPNNETDGARTDGRNLIKHWQSLKSNTGKSYKYVQNRSALMGVDAENTDYLLGLFSGSHMEYEMSRNNQTEPSLAEMTETAIKTLKKHKKGFALLVEGGRIDHAHHMSSPKRALIETLAFDKAVEKALELTDPEETLIVVTADHSHVFTMGFTPTRGNDILGLVNAFPIDYYTPLDNKSVPTLSYSNGPGGLMPGDERSNFSNKDTTSDDYVAESLVPSGAETHSGEDVPLYAQGPMAHLFRGVMDQTVIHHLLARAACIGEYSDCSWDKMNNEPMTCGQDKLSYSIMLIILTIIHYVYTVKSFM